MKSYQIKISSREIALISITSAIVLIATAFFRIPIPLGYAHIGNAVILISVLILPHKIASTSAVLGSALADLVSGFPIWVVPTIVIKYLMAEIFYYFAYSRGKRLPILKSRTLIGLTLSSIVMIAGYTLAGAVLFGDMTVALSSTPLLAMEGIFNSLLAIVIMTFSKLKRIN